MHGIPAMSDFLRSFRQLCSAVSYFVAQAPRLRASGRDAPTIPAN
jgi:hypothetical protein